MVNHKIFVYGIDKAGKTVISNYLATGELLENTKPTLSFSIYRVGIQRFNFAIWDAPGQTKLRKQWDKRSKNSNLLIFVLDTADNLRFEESKIAFLSTYQSIECPVIFCFHKMDLPEAKANLQEAKELFNLEDRIKTLETTINNLDTLDKLKEFLVQEITGQEFV
jgi:small GTP-binding protein